MTIVVSMLQRAEHNEGMVSTLEEVALHQSNIEKIEVLGQICPRLKILYLQSNLIGKIQNVHKLKVRALGGNMAHACRHAPRRSHICMPPSSAALGPSIPQHGHQQRDQSREPPKVRVAREAGPDHELCGQGRPAERALPGGQCAPPGDLLDGQPMHRLARLQAVRDCQAAAAEEAGG